MKHGFVYILSNKKRTTLYVGVTNNLEIRMLQHKSGNGSIFSSKYKTFDLLYFEKILGIKNAIAREKQLKNWHKEWKWNLIKESNPAQQDLAADWHSQSEIEEYQQMITEATNN